MAKNASAPAEPEPPLKGGDGGGTCDRVEARIAKLEAHMEHVQSDLAKLGGLPAEIAGIKADIAGIKSDVSHLPTKDYISQQFDVQFRWIIGVVSMVVALIGLIVRMTM